MFVPGKTPQPSVMFAGKAGDYLSEAPFKRSALRYAPGLTNKHYTRLERLAGDKHSSLLRESVNYDRKKFYGTGPGVSTNIALFYMKK